MNVRVLIIGGTGVFGKRLATHLASQNGINLFISSRSAQKAQDFVATLKSKAPNLQIQGIGLDHARNLKVQLDAIKPFAVIDCSGPFQTANYDTARTVIASGAHLIDLADARDYLANFHSDLDDLAKFHDVSALTGASSTPTLSACVADHITRGWQRVDTIDIAITPGGKSEVGRSVIAAILSYAGKKIPLWKNGELCQTTGWVGATHITIPALGTRRVSPVETYDAEHLGARFSVQSRVSFRAGLESRFEQFGLEIIATLRKYHLFPDPKHLIPLLLAARKITRISTSDQGGMLVEITGLNAAGQFTQTKWSLLAKDDHGPYIPILPAAAALEKLRHGRVASGAALASTALTLPDILAQMAPYAITTQTSERHADQSPFETHFGQDTYRSLAPAVQAFHAQSAPPIWQGQADIKGGSGIIALVLGRVFGFPKSGHNVPVTIRVDRTLAQDGRPIERWTRKFDNKSMSSVLERCKDRSFTESFAPFTFHLDLHATGGAIIWPVTRWALGKIPLPAVLAPRSISREFEDEKGRFRFDVRLSLPLFGELAHYQGWLVPKPPQPLAQQFPPSPR